MNSLYEGVSLPAIWQIFICDFVVHEEEKIFFKNIENHPAYSRNFSKNDLTLEVL